MTNDQWEWIHQTRRYETIDSAMDWKLGYSRIDTLLGDITGKKLLDYGCGPGKYTRHLARGGAHVVGVDKSPSAIKSAKKAGEKNIDYHITTNDALPFTGSNSLDDAVATFTFCSIKNRRATHQDPEGNL